MTKAPIDVTLAIIIPILGILFIGTGWIKVGEEMQYIHLLSSQINEAKK